MYISDKFKRKALKAKEKGYNKVFSISGQYFETTYITKWEIEELLSKPIGSSVRAIKAGGGVRWSGFPTLKNIEKDEIRYTDLMINF